MNTEKHFLRLVPALNFNQIRVGYKGTILYKQYGDLFVVMINEPKEKIPDNLYGLTIRDVEVRIPDDPKDRARIFDKAGWNSRYCMPPRIFSSQKIGSDDLFHTGLFMEDEQRYGYSNAIIDKKMSINGLRLTTSCWFGGAVAVFYPGVAKRLSILLNSDFFVTFPTQHEARIHSAVFTDPHQVHGAITDWNRVKYGPFGGMSGNVFRYCAARDDFQQIEYYDWAGGAGMNNFE